MVFSFCFNFRGSCISKIIGNNLLRLYEEDGEDNWSKEVRMWVFEEMIPSPSNCLVMEPLSEIINSRHENTKYLPGIKLPDNVLAVPNLVDAINGCNLLVFVVPHQFVQGICDQLVGKLVKGCRVISLIKGLDSSKNDMELISKYIKNRLSVDVSVLMGANLANDIARERFSESTIGFENELSGSIWKNLFETKYFRISLIKDVMGVELCGALKNIVALATGIVDGLYPSNSDNTKAAIIRIGMQEIRGFCRIIDERVRDETFWESCGVADIITSSYGGRNNRVAEEFILMNQEEPLKSLEARLLNGQKLQGPPTCKIIYQYLIDHRLESHFPLFRTVYKIFFENRSAKEHFFNDIIE